MSTPKILRISLFQYLAVLFLAFHICIAPVPVRADFNAFTFENGTQNWKGGEYSWVPTNGVDDSGYVVGHPYFYGWTPELALNIYWASSPPPPLGNFAAYLNGVFYFCSKHAGPLKVDLYGFSPYAGSIALHPIRQLNNGWNQYAAPLNALTFQSGTLAAILTNLNGIIVTEFHAGAGSPYEDEISLDNVFFVRPSNGTTEQVDAATYREVTTPTQVTDDVGRLLSPSTEITGVAADGTSRLLLRKTFSGPGTWTVNFVTPGVSQKNGELAEPSAAFSATATIQHQVRATGVGSEHIGTIVYRAPLDFVRDQVPADNLAPTRIVQVQTDFNPAGTSIHFAETIDITLVRPPVVFAHGLWSSSNTWGGAFLPLVNGGNGLFTTYSWDYSGNNNSSLATNVPGVARAIDSALQRARSQGIVATKVDWVGHSMGAVLPRAYYAATQQGVIRYWNRSQNYLSGDIRKLITLNSPQNGSPTSNFLVALSEQHPIILTILSAIKHPLGLAHRDLSIGSAALAGIGTTPIWSHTLVGVGGVPALNAANATLGTAGALLGGIWGNVLQAMGWFTTSLINQDIFQGVQHDIIVGQASQTGGLSGGATTISTATTTIHTNVTSLSSYASEVVDLLNYPLVRTSLPVSHFAPSMPPPTTSYFTSPISSPLPAPLSSGLSIISPPAHSQVAPGQVVTIVVGSTGGFIPSTVQFMSSWDQGTVSSAPFQRQFTIPVDSIGTVSFVAFAEDSSGTRAIANPLELDISVSAQVQSIQVEPEQINVTAPLAVQALKVTALFSDNVLRDITSANAGTIYSSSDQNVVTVTPDGLLEVKGQGSATISITNSNGQPWMRASTEVIVGYARSVGYGEAAVGSGGIAPFLSTGDEEPRLGNNNFAIKAHSVVGGAPGLLMACFAPGQFSVLGVKIWCDPSTISTFFVLSNGASGSPGAGEISYSLPIPANPAYEGVEIYWQAIFFDPGAPQGFSATPGMVTTIR